MLRIIQSASNETVKECSLVMVKGVYISGLVMSNDIAELTSNNIMAIVRCRGEPSIKSINGQITQVDVDNDTYKNRPLVTREFIRENGITETVFILPDSPKANIGQYFKDAINAIHIARSHGKNVLVHCDMGISRSVTLVLAYQIWMAAHSIKNMPTVTDLVTNMRTKRSIINPNPGFINALGHYRNAWNVERHKIRKFKTVQIQPTLTNLMKQAGELIRSKFGFI